MTSNILPYASVARIIANAGAERISKESKLELTQFLEEKGTQISETAKALAEHAGRKTVQGEDITFALKQLGY